MNMQWFSSASALIYLMFGLISPGAAETLTVAGTGSSGPIVQRLFDEFRKQHPEASLNIVTPPLGSGGSLKALPLGRIDMAFAGRPMKPAEQARVGRYFEFALTPLVFASSNGSHGNGFSLDELADIYAGKTQTWRSGHPIRLVLRASFESDTLLMRSMSPAMDTAVDAAAQRPGMVMGNNDLDTLDLIINTPGSLGPTTLGLLATSNAKLKVFALNGKEPNLGNLKNGSYPWAKSITAVLPQTPSPLAENFANFLRSDEAKAVLQKYDYLPADQ